MPCTFLRFCVLIQASRTAISGHVVIRVAMAFSILVCFALLLHFVVDSQFFGTRTNRCRSTLLVSVCAALISCVMTA